MLCVCHGEFCEVSLLYLCIVCGLCMYYVLLCAASFAAPQRDRYACVIVSIGDCKAFHWRASDGAVTDITIGNRTELDVRDPGGRLGPHLRYGVIT